MFRYFVIPLLLSCELAMADTTIAFGSCLKQWSDVPVLQTIAASKPDAFVFLGDNMYSDNGKYRFRLQPDRITEAYEELAANADFRALRASGTPIFATWDDHDYGLNNAGAEYPWKTASKAEFMRFFATPADSPMRRREGIYHSHMLGDEAFPIQLILLDTRTFRSALREAGRDATCPKSNLVANDNAAATVLGEAQWRWLEQTLQEPAALRIIASSIQFIPNEHCWEKWGNFPLERRRLLTLLRDTGAGRTLIISGDRHMGEISMLQGNAPLTTLYEVTASGLNSAISGIAEHNSYRTHADTVGVDHYGSIQLYQHTAAGVPELMELAIRDRDGQAVERLVIEIESWQPPAATESALQRRQ